jgi:hypothetical protein
MDPAEDFEDAVPLLESSLSLDQRSQISRPEHEKRKPFSIKPTALIRPPKGLDLSVPRHANPKYLYLLTAFVSIGALLFGFDQGVMGVIVADDRWLDLMKPSSPCSYSAALICRALYADHEQGLPVQLSRCTILDAQWALCLLGSLQTRWAVNALCLLRALSSSLVHYCKQHLIQSRK